MRFNPLPAIALALALTLALPAAAQDTSLPDAKLQDPRGVLSDQRLEVTNKGIAYAVLRLEEAAEDPDRTAVSGAFEQSRQAIEELRRLLQPLPDEESAPFEAAAGEAETALAGQDPAAVAEAMRTLRQRMLDLLAARG